MTKFKNIDDALLKMQTMTPEDYEYEFYWTAVMEHYTGLIHKLIGRCDAHEDYFNDCVLKLPHIIESWEPIKGKFSTHLTWRLRGYIQQLKEQNSLIGFCQRSQDQQAKRKKRESKTLSIIPVKQDAYSDTESKEGKLYPQTFQTVIEDINFADCMKLIDDLEDIQMWKDYYLEDLNLREIADKHKTTNYQADRVIKNLHRIVTARLIDNV